MRSGRKVDPRKRIRRILHPRKDRGGHVPRRSLIYENLPKRREPQVQKRKNKFNSVPQDLSNRIHYICIKYGGDNRR